MHVILGGTGQVGSAAARSLLQRGEQVTIVTRDADHGSELREAGAYVAVADVRDVKALRELFRSAKRAFLLNPPASPDTDTDAEERANVAAIMEALEASSLEKVVAASTYGARPGKRCGDLTVLYEFEQCLKAQSVPAVINRAAYYLSNWSGMLDTARQTGMLPSFFPADMSIPMVAPRDVGEAAARCLLEPAQDVELRHVEGPRHYSPVDVARAFGEALGRTVDVEVIPRKEWKATFLGLGFSRSAAQSYACMTETVVDAGPEAPAAPDRGVTTLQEFVQDLVEAETEATRGRLRIQKRRA